MEIVGANFKEKTHTFEIPLNTLHTFWKIEVFYIDQFNKLTTWIEEWTGKAMKSTTVDALLKVQKKLRNAQHLSQSENDKLFQDRRTLIEQMKGKKW